MDWNEKVPAAMGYTSKEIRSRGDWQRGSLAATFSLSYEHTSRGGWSEVLSEAGNVRVGASAHPIR